MPDISITATYPYDFVFSADPDVADGERPEFMQRAQNAIVDAGLLGINRTKFDNVETIMRCCVLEDADINERGYVVPVRGRDCAERLLAAGLLDQTAEDIVERWGPVTPSIPWESQRG